MTTRDLILEVLEALRDMNDAINVIIDLDVDAVIKEMEADE